MAGNCDGCDFTVTCPACGFAFASPPGCPCPRCRSYVPPAVELDPPPGPDDAAFPGEA